MGLNFTLEEKQTLNTLHTKSKRILDKYYEYENKFGKIKGSLFDGGFYVEIDEGKMTKEEYKEYKDLRDNINLIEKIFK